MTTKPEQTQNKPPQGGNEPHRGELSTPTPERGADATKAAPPNTSSITGTGSVKSREPGTTGDERDEPQKPGLHPRTESPPLAKSTEHTSGEISSPTPARGGPPGDQSLPPAKKPHVPLPIERPPNDDMPRNEEIAPPVFPPPNHPHIPVKPPAVPLTRADVTGQATPNNAVPARAPVAVAKTVRVRLIWPEARGAKEDCRAGTGTIWTGHGDVQDFPAAKWYLLAPHRDVWELVNEADTKVVAQAEVDRVETTGARVARINAERGIGNTGIDGPHERARMDAERARVLAAQTNTDTVVLSPGPSMGRPATEHAPTYPVAEHPPNHLAPSTYDAAALAPHTQTARLEAEARAEGAGAADPDHTEVPLRAIAHPVDPVKAARHAATKRYSADELEALSDADIHAEGLKRAYVLHPRLTPVNLRLRFLELQGAR